MEFDMQGGSFEVSGGVEVELPAFMAMLPQEELNEVHQAPARANMVIAAGRRPNTAEIVVMTGAGRLMSLDGDRHQVPEGRAVPGDFGHSIVIVRDPHYEISAAWFVANAQPIAGVTIR